MAFCAGDTTITYFTVMMNPQWDMNVTPPAAEQNIASEHKSDGLSYLLFICSFITTLHLYVPTLTLVYEWFGTVEGHRPAVVLIQPFTCVGPDRSV